MERIGFFGGCFNPITNIHINIANNLIKEEKLDKVVFVPVNNYYQKTELSDAKQRLDMIKLAIKDYSKLEVDDFEIKENRKLYAADVFEKIYNKFKNEKEIFFLMGSDNYEKMPQWKEYDRIKDKYNYIVIERDENEVSSTQIREMIKNGNKKVMEYLSKEVYNYIIENNLYN